MRVSPPELEREFPGPQESSNVTLAPLCCSCSADQPPKAPAPTTTTEARGELAKTREWIREAVPATTVPFKNVRRELVVSFIAFAK
jgi:hypothetical protein